jgi:hypothetical protein
MNLSNTEAADKLVRQFDIHWALLHPTEPIIYKLMIDGWKELYRDSEAVVLTR